VDLSKLMSVCGFCLLSILHGTVIPSQGFMKLRFVNIKMFAKSIFFIVFLILILFLLFDCALSLFLGNLELRQNKSVNFHCLDQ